MQQLTLLGNIGRDAVVRETNGRRAISFSVAVNESYKTAAGEKIDNTTWYDCTIWREAGQSISVAQYLTRGQQVLVQGKISVKTYVSQKDGKTYAALEVKVSNTELVGSKREDSPAPSPNHPVVGAAEVPAGHTDNDLPF